MADDTPVQPSTAKNPAARPDSRCGDDDRPRRWPGSADRAGPDQPPVVMGGGIMPARCWPPRSRPPDDPPAGSSGDGPPEPRYVPSRQLADFVRCRDLTCRFPGCESRPIAATLDHTIPYPVGPTWRLEYGVFVPKTPPAQDILRVLARQLPDGTIIWTAPSGQTYTTHAGSRLLFPTLCQPTAPRERACG